MVNIKERDRTGVAIPAGKHIRPAIERMLGNKGFDFHWEQNGGLHAAVEELPVDLTVVNQRDIIRQVEQGFFTAGFVGSELFAEYSASRPEREVPKVESIARFFLFSPTIRLSLLVRKGDDNSDKPYQEVEDLEKQRVITSYPALTKMYFLKHVEDKKKMPVIGTVTGKEEGQLAGRLAEAAVVIVDSGETMNANNLKELDVVMGDIQPVLLVNSEFLRAQGGAGSQRSWSLFVDRLENGYRPSRSFPVLPEPELGRYGTIVGLQSPTV